MITVKDTRKKLSIYIQQKVDKIFVISNKLEVRQFTDDERINSLKRELDTLEDISKDLETIEMIGTLDAKLFRDIVVNAIRLETANISSLKSIEMLEARQNQVIADKIRVMFNSQTHFKDMDSFLKCLEGWNTFCNGLANLFKRR